jgi:hypothetical protein
MLGWSVFWYAAAVSAQYPDPYVVIVNKPDGGKSEMYFAVYEKDEDDNYTQVEVPRRIKEGQNIRLYLEGRLPSEVIIMSRDADDLKLNLDEDDASSLSIIELKDAEALKGKTVRGKLRTSSAEGEDIDKIKEFEKDSAKRKQDLVKTGDQIEKQDVTKTKGIEYKEGQEKKIEAEVNAAPEPVDVEA